MGVMIPSDWTILETLPEYDAILKQTIAGKGDAWFRYNFDGYGEHNDGRDYDGSGRGRLWPIFTAERGIYEIAKSGNGAQGSAYLAALKAFSSPSEFSKRLTHTDDGRMIGPLLMEAHMGTFALKDARLELKTTKETKDLLSKAAILGGVDLSAFMLAAAVEKARAILRDHAAIALSAEGQVQLAKLLQEQPEPTEAMKEFRKQSRLAVRG